MTQMFYMQDHQIPSILGCFSRPSTEHTGDEGWCRHRGLSLNCDDEKATNCCLVPEVSRPVSTCISGDRKGQRSPQGINAMIEPEPLLQLVSFAQLGWLVSSFCHSDKMPEKYQLKVLSWIIVSEVSVHSRLAVSGSEERKSFVVERKKIRPSVATRKQREGERRIER